MDSNKIIQSLWVGTELSNVEKLCIKSFLANGHEFHLYTYQDIKGVPPGTTIQDANLIIPESEIFKITVGWGTGSYSAFADWFRYELLYKAGGWWVDMDVVCVKYFDIKESIVICTSHEPPYGVLANNCIMKFPKESDVVNEMIKICRATDKNKVEFGQLSPHLIQRMVKEYTLEQYLVPYYYFNPIRWAYVDDYIAFRKKTLKQQIKELVRPLLKPKTMAGRKVEKESYAVHLWNEVWRQSGLDKNNTYHKNCIVEQLKKRYR